MPKVSNKIDYSTMPISFYKFVCQDDNVNSCYVGSTGNFRQRKHQHKHACTSTTNLKYNYLIYQTIREHGGWNNWRPVEIITHNCVDKLQIAVHERFYIDALKPSLNTQIPLRTRKEWISCNRPKINKIANNYYHKNKEVCLETQKRWRASNKEKLKINKKIYYDKNKDKILQRKKEKYALSKETNPSESV